VLMLPRDHFFQTFKHQNVYVIWLDTNVYKHDTRRDVVFHTLTWLLFQWWNCTL
jgi:hypothetical protein